MRVHATVCLMVLTATAVYSSAGEVLSPVAVASLGGHTADAWVSGSKCIDSTLAEKIKCNLGVYESAISRSSVEGAKLIALPEAYGVMGHPKDENKYFEEMASFVGNNPCGNATLSPISPQQYHLSCFAKKYRIAVASNIFVRLQNETRRCRRRWKKYEWTVTSSVQNRLRTWVPW